MFVAARQLLLVVFSSPFGLHNRMRRPFVKRLSQKVRIRLTAMCGSRVAALPDHRCDPGISLDLGGAIETLTLGSQCCDQAWSQSIPGAGQRIEEGKIGVRPGELLDPFLTSGNVLLQVLDYRTAACTIRTLDWITALSCVAVTD